jgi:hypothetical protein
MKLKTFLGISAVILGLFGLSMIFNSANMAKGFGLDLNDLSVVLFRDLGSTLIGVAVINWMARGTQDTKALKAIVLGNLVIQVLGVIVNVADITQGYMGSGGWVGVLLHAVLAAGFAYYYLRPQKS